MFLAAAAMVQVINAADVIGAAYKSLGSKRSFQVSMSNFEREESNSIKISNCIRIYHMTTLSEENSLEEQKNCTYFSIDSLNQILQNQHLEVSIDQNCIHNKTNDSQSNVITLSLSIGDVNGSDTALARLHSYIEGNHGEVNLNEEKIKKQRNAAFGIYNETKENGIPGDILNDLDEIKILLNSLKNIQTIILNSIDLGSFGARVFNDTIDFLNSHERAEDITAVTEVEEYLLELEMEVESVRKLNKLLGIQNMSSLLSIPWISCLLDVRRWESELINERLMSLQVEDRYHKVMVLKTFQTYVDPAMYTIILTVGLVWNGVLVLMFAGQKQLWTPPNIMIFNLAVADLLSLILNLLLFYFAHYYVLYFQVNESFCKFYITVRPLTVALSALSVVVLSIIRYIATGQSFRIHSNQIVCNLSTRARTILYVVVVWLLSLCLAMPYSYVIMFSKGMCFRYGEGKVAKMVTLFEFLFYCVLLPSIVVVFNSMTARGLKQSTKNFTTAMRLSGQDQVRNRSAKVLMGLVIVFLISYVPHYLWRVLHRWLRLDVWEIHYRIIDKITYYLLFANCCFNPISLYIVSGTFRKLFNYYFSYIYHYHCNRRSKRQLERLRSSSSMTMNSLRTRF